MPEEMTYTTLLQDVRDYLERTDIATDDPIFTRQLPRLINLAEKRISVDLKVEGTQQTLTGALVAGTPVLPKPSGWRKTISFTVGLDPDFEQRTVLIARPYESATYLNPDRRVTGVPRWYPDYNVDNWFISPTPNLAYPLEVLVYALPPQLDNSNQKNWVTETVPNALLYAVLMESAPFLKSDERLPLWQGMYTTFIGGVKQEDVSRAIDRSNVRS